MEAPAAGLVADPFAKGKLSRLKQTLLLVGAIWLLGALGGVRPEATWAALGLYVLGSLILLAWRTLGCSEAEAVFLRGPGLRDSLLWGGGAGLALLLAGLLALPAMRAAMPAGDGSFPLEAIKGLLFDHGLILLLPVLVLAEEGLWRGLLLSALRGNGMAEAIAITLSTLAFMVNHLAVAPLALVERGMLALMALPLGLMSAVLTVRTRVLWGAALLHLLVMGAMLGSLR
jgi:membrane protease YdiL (CAAX protease family)